MIARNIQADILAVLDDGEYKTYQQIADIINVHKMTVYKHIKALSFHHNIETFCGGENKGGVRLIKQEVSLAGLSGKELQQVITHLQSLQDCSVSIKTFVKRLQNHLEKGEQNESKVL